MTPNKSRNPKWARGEAEQEGSQNPSLLIIKYGEDCAIYSKEGFIAYKDDLEGAKITIRDLAFQLEIAMGTTAKTVAVPVDEENKEWNWPEVKQKALEMLGLGLNDELEVSRTWVLSSSHMTKEDFDRLASKPYVLGATDEAEQITFSACADLHALSLQYLEPAFQTARTSQIAQLQFHPAGQVVSALEQFEHSTC